MAKIDDEMKTRFPNARQRAVTNIVYTGSWIRTQFVEFIQPFGLSPQQFNVLRILRGAGDWLAMHEVRERMVEKSPNTTRLCDKLVEKGLIHRNRRTSDRRLVLLKISVEGLELLAEIDKVDKMKHQPFLHALSDDEAQQLSDLLDKLRE